MSNNKNQQQNNGRQEFCFCCFQELKWYLVFVYAVHVCKTSPCRCRKAFRQQMYWNWNAWLCASISYAFQRILVLCICWCAPFWIIYFVHSLLAATFAWSMYFWCVLKWTPWSSKVKFLFHCCFYIRFCKKKKIINVKSWNADCKNHSNVGGNGVRKGKLVHVLIFFSFFKINSFFADFF